MSDKTEYMKLETEIVQVLKNIFDPEIPINIYDLGLIYRIDVDEKTSEVSIDMTLTAPNCPVADSLVQEVKEKVEAIDDVGKLNFNLVFDPPWNKDMMSEEAMLELGFL